MKKLVNENQSLKAEKEDMEKQTQSVSKEMKVLAKENERLNLIIEAEKAGLIGQSESEDEGGYGRPSPGQYEKILEENQYLR